MLQKFEVLVDEGSRLTPLGGFDFSGYNARMQDKYLAWRKSCLESLEIVGPIGFPYKNKIIADANGGFFYQSSANLIYTSMRELLEKLKASPELAAEPAKVSTPVPQSVPMESQASGPGGTRTLKPPPKGVSAATSASPVAAAVAETVSKVYVVGEINDPLRQQLASFLEEVGVVEIPVDRIRGEMISLENIVHEEGARFAFFVLSSADLAYAMFELGHFVGKLGKNHVMVLHMTDTDVPKNIPGVLVKPIVVKLEEASFSIMKELKSAGYSLSI